MTIPTSLLENLYNRGSLKNSDTGVQFTMKNRLTDANLIRLGQICFNGEKVPMESVKIDVGGGKVLSPDTISADSPVPFALRQELTFVADIEALAEGKHEIEIQFSTEPFGDLSLKVEGSISNRKEGIIDRIPRTASDDYSDEAIQKRWDYIKEKSGADFHHIKQHSFDPHVCRGNVEHFSGVAQVPLGFAGPLDIHGEHAEGKFVIPLATSEGTLVASYNRGMKAINLSGGVKVTVLEDAMQRAPVFVFDDAREGKKFLKWFDANYDEVKKRAEETSSVAKLKHVERYMASKFIFLRFNFSTGDAAGQNMVGKATFAACNWILKNYDDSKVRHFYLESNFATDKKASYINTLRTRGKRVVAEAIIKRDILRRHMRVRPEALIYHQSIGNVSTMMAGLTNNGAHSPNALAALFIATGQDVANLAESSTGIFHGEVTEDGDLYMSLTIPSLIVATYGGGTGLPTQQECLGILGCVGKGKVHKLAEIFAAVALSGELSLASAISSSDWVSSHEAYGRNR